MQQAADTRIRRRRIVEGGAVFLVAIAAYANTIHADFTLDDVPIVKENELIRSLGNIGKFFTTNYWGEGDKANDKSLYRPLTIASYALNYAIHGLSPRGYHAVNIVLHACVCLLLYALVLAVFGDARAALASGVLFAVHPIHTEVVAGIVGRAEIMALLGGLLSCLTFVFATKDAGSTGKRGGSIWVVMSIAAYAFGVFSKEIGLMGPIMIVLWESILPHRRRLFRAEVRAIAAFVGYGFVAIVFLLMRASAVQTNNINVGFIGVTTGERILTALRVGLEYVGLLVAPVRLSADYWVTDVPIAGTPWEFGVIAAFTVLAGLMAMIVVTWRRRAGVAWGIFVFLALLFPVSNLPFRIGVLKAERLLYSPSAGFIVAFAALATTVYALAWMRRAAWCGVWILAAVFLARTWARNDDWRDNRTLAEVTLRTSPSSPVFNTVMGNWYRQQKRNGPAREHFLRSIESQPDNTTALFDLGNIELEEKRFDSAIHYYRQALHFQPNYLSALNNLGRALAESGRLREAVDVLERSRQVRPTNPGAYVNLLSVYIQLKDFEAAIPLAEDAQRRFPDIAAVYWNAGSIYLLSGRKQEAEAAYRRAKQLDPKGGPEGDVKSPMD